MNQNQDRSCDLLLPGTHSNGQHKGIEMIDVQGDRNEFENNEHMISNCATLFLEFNAELSTLVM